MNINIKSFFFFCFILGFSPSISAQNLIEDVLREPIEKALDKSADVQIKEMEEKKIKMEKGEARANRLPNISLMGGYGYMDSHLSLDLPEHRLPITDRPLFEGAQKVHMNAHNILGGISVQQVIFTGMQIPNGIKALEEKRKAHEHLTYADKEKTAKEVITAFDQLMLLREADKLIKDSEKRLKKEQKKVKKGIKNGLAIPYDRDKIKLAILELDEKKIELNGNRNLLFAQLRHLTGMTKEELTPIEYELNSLLAENVSAEVDNRPEIKALAAGKEAREYALKKEKGGQWPTVFAFGNLSYFSAFDSRIKFKDIPGNRLPDNATLRTNHINMQPSALLGVGIKWSIYGGGAKKKKIKKADLDLRISEKELEDTQEKLELLLEKNREKYMTAEQKVKVAKQQMKIAENNLDLAQKQFRSGMVDVTERLSSENDFYKANLNYYQNVIEQRGAVLELVHSTGELLDKIDNDHE